MTDQQSFRAQGTIMVVDDTRADLRLLVDMLTRAGYAVRPHLDGAAALNGALAEAPDLILLDVNMPQISGYEVCRQLRADSRTAHVPVIFISASDEVFNKLKAFAVGGMDYITKPFQATEVLARVGAHLNVHLMRQRLAAQNARLQQEIIERQCIEAELQQHREHLEELVAARTAELERANAHLQQEIIERKQVEEVLRVKERVIASAINAIVIAGSDGTVTYVNPSLLRMWGYDHERDVIGRSIRELWTYEEDEAPRVSATLLATDSWIGEVTAWRKDGSPFDAQLSASLTREDSGEPAYLLGSFIDITQRKRAERMLQALNAAALAMQNSLAPDRVFTAIAAELRKVGLHFAVFLTTDDRCGLRVAYWTYAQQAVRIVEQLTGFTIDRVILPTDQIDAFRQVIREQRTIFVEDAREPARQFLPGPLKRLAGSVVDVLQVPKSINAPLIVEDDVIGLFSVQSSDLSASDIEAVTAFSNQLAAAWRQSRLFEQARLELAARRQAEEQIRRLNEELEQRVLERTRQLEEALALRIQAETAIRELNQRLYAQANNLVAANKELEAFSYSVSHDLRAPLRAIDGYTRILAEDYAPSLDAEGQRLCSVIQQQTRRMGQLIDDLLAFSRLGRIEMQPAPIDMATLVHTVFGELTMPEERSQIEFHLSPLPPALGDPTLIRQVWLNLLANALKFSSRKPHITIEVGSMSAPGETIYYVRDNGAGFDMQYADKLFGVFQRLHSERDFPGTGVGLAIVQRAVHRHGGRVWGEGAVDQGATFYFSLPCHR